MRAGSGQQTIADSGPGMVAPSPVEMLLVALGGCDGMDVISILRKKRQRVTAYEVDGDRRPARRAPARVHPHRDGASGDAATT